VWTDDGVIAQHLYVVGADGSTELDSGAIDRDSVAVGDGVVYWTNAGELRSAPLS
jgi:hypothetical protein